MAQSLYWLMYPDPHVAGSYVVNIGHITAENRHAEINELLKMYFAEVGTLFQRRINKTENRRSSVFNVSDNITDIQIFPLKNKYTSAEIFLINM